MLAALAVASGAGPSLAFADADLRTSAQIATQAIPTAVRETGVTRHPCPQELEPAAGACPNERTLHLIVKWPGRTHRFLQNPSVRVTAILGTTQITLTPTIGAGEGDEALAVATLPLDDAERRQARSVILDWSIQFEPKIKLPGMRAARQTLVLHDSELDTIRWASCTAPTFAGTAAPSPLATRVFDASALTLTITLDTSVVDLTDLYPEAAKGIDIEHSNPVQVWNAADPKHEKIRMLASTVGGPALWTAYVASADSDPSRSTQPVSRMVIYPHEINFWDPGVGLGGPRHTLMYANKYLLADCVHPPRRPLPGTECHWVFDSHGERQNWISPGFGPGLEASGKRGVVLIPWVVSATDTVAHGYDMPGHTLSMLHLLQSEGRIAADGPLVRTAAAGGPSPARRPENATGVSGGSGASSASGGSGSSGESGRPAVAGPVSSPLIIAGYSGGGDGEMRAFEHFSDRIDGFWGFDPISHTREVYGGLGPSELKKIAEWQRADPTRQVRVSDSMFEDRWARFFREQKTNGVPASQLTHEYVQGSKESLRWFGTQLAPHPDGWDFHQFTVNGGRQDSAGHRTSYFEEFSDGLP